MIDKERKWKLEIKGTLIVPSATFKDADALVMKAIQAVAEVYDVDITGQEVVKR